MPGGDVEAMWRARDAQVPMGHMGDAWDVANAALFLASDESKYVTGIELDGRRRDHLQGGRMPSRLARAGTTVWLLLFAMRQNAAGERMPRRRLADRQVQELHRQQRDAP